MKNYYLLYKYSTYPINESSQLVAGSKSYHDLQFMTENLGNKWFINHSTGGSRFAKSIVDGTWTTLNNQALSDQIRRG